jgi:hypothetical protein
MTDYNFPAHAPDGFGITPPGGPHQKSGLRASIKSLIAKKPAAIILGLALGLLPLVLGFLLFRPYLPYWLPVLAQPIQDRPSKEIGTEKTEAGVRETFAATLHALGERDPERLCEFIAAEDRAAIGMIGGTCTTIMKDGIDEISKENLKSLTNCEIDSITLSENNTKAVVIQRACKGVSEADRRNTYSYDQDQGRWVMSSE